MHTQESIYERVREIRERFPFRGANVIRQNLRVSAPKVRSGTDPNSVQTGTEPPVSVLVPHLAELKLEVQFRVWAATDSPNHPKLGSNGLEPDFSVYLTRYLHPLISYNFHSMSRPRVQLRSHMT